MLAQATRNAPLPAMPIALAGRFRWDRHPNNTGELRLQSADFTSKWYLIPDRAIAEVERWQLSQPATPEAELPPLIRRGKAVSLSTTTAGDDIDDRAALATLPGALQALAFSFVAARRKIGSGTLEAAQYLAEARSQAHHGEWGRFLASIGTSDDQAERLLRIARLATENPAFAEAVRHNFLSAAVAAELAAPGTPPELIERVMEQSERPSRALIRAEKRDAKIRAGADFDQPADPPAEKPAPPCPNCGRPAAQVYGVKGSTAHCLHCEAPPTVTLTIRRDDLVELRRLVEAAVATLDDGPYERLLAAIESAT
jgi:hypothetical protein